MNNQESSKSHHFAQLLLTIFTLMASFSALAQNNALACGSLKNHYGPFDYRTNRDKLEIVEPYRSQFGPDRWEDAVAAATRDMIAELRPIIL